MDDKTLAVLKYILSNKDNSGGYIVVESNDLIQSLPIDLTLSKSEVERIIKRLSYLKFINLEYNDGENFCLLVTDKAKVYSEEVKTQKQQEINYKKLFIYSFLGGVIGALINAIISLFIIVF